MDPKVSLIIKIKEVVLGRQSASSLRKQGGLHKFPKSIFVFKVERLYVYTYSPLGGCEGLNSSGEMCPVRGIIKRAFEFQYKALCINKHMETRPAFFK